MKTLLASITCPLLVLALAACGDDEEATSAPTVSSITTTPPATTGTATPRPTVILINPTVIDVCLPNPDPATSDVNSVTLPAPGDVTTSPVQVTGQIAAFEATFQVTIFDAQGNKLADQFAMSNEGQTLAPFSTSVPFTVTEETPACLWVYELSAQDGSPIHVVQVPLTLQP